MAINRKIQVFASIREFFEKLPKIRPKLVQKLLSLCFNYSCEVFTYGNETNKRDNSKNHDYHGRS